MRVKSPGVPLPTTSKALEKEELEHRAKVSIGVRSPKAELPTAEEVARLLDGKKDVVFSKLVIEELEALGDKADEFAKRPRVEGVTFSIDDYATTDLDNAISYRAGDDGTHFVSVSGTDVSEWIRPGSALDAAARRRVETEYNSDAGLVFPMFPLPLSEGKFSFFQGEERLAKTVELHFSATGELLESRAYRSVLVNEQISAQDASLAKDGGGRAEKNPALGKALSALCSLGGAVSGSPGSDISMGKLTSLFTTLAATELGKKLKEAGLEASFRNQSEQNAKSTYGAVPTGHAAVGSEAYATFTGPMRRYADLDVQRAMDRLIDGDWDSPRKADIDSRMRQVQLKRLNHETSDERLHFRDALVEVTRKSADAVEANVPAPTEPPKAPADGS